MHSTRTFHLVDCEALQTTNRSKTAQKTLKIYYDIENQKHTNATAFFKFECVHSDGKWMNKTNKCGGSMVCGLVKCYEQDISSQ